MSQPQLTPSSIGSIGAFAGQAAASGMARPAMGMLGEREVVRNTGKQAIVSFLESQTCYSVLRASGKVVVFDTRIPIQLAFYALVEHGERRTTLGRMGRISAASSLRKCGDTWCIIRWGGVKKIERCHFAVLGG